MSTIACPGCGGQFPLAAVAAYETFTCSTCGHVVKVPVAAPAPVPTVQPIEPVRPAKPAQPAKRAQPAARPKQVAQRPAAAKARPAASKPRQRAAAAQRPAAAKKPAARRAASPAEPETAKRGRDGGRSRGRGGRDEREAPDKGKPPVALFVGGGVVLLGLAGLPFLMMGDGEGDLPPATTMGDTTMGDTANAPAGTVGDAPAGPAGAGSVSTEPETPAPPPEPEKLDAIPLIKKTFRECEFADDVAADPVYRLRLLMAKNKDKRGKWEVSGDELEKVRTLLNEVEIADRKLRESDAEMARAHWVTYLRTIEVMKDYPMLNASVGPYLIFVQVDADPGTTIDEADPEAVAKAQEILDRNVVLFRNFYEGWMTEVAPHFGFERYTEENVERDTIFKATVFASHKSYMEYNIRIGSGRTAGSARAYYSLQEPRFICTYEGEPEKKEGEEDKTAAGSETREYIDQVQTHEATHQLVHFYTWDVTRKAIGRNPRWLDALTRPLWSTEGFAEFFSSHTEENGVFKWMQPLNERMEHLWIFQEILEKKNWAPWELDQMLSIRNGGQLQGLGMARAVDPNDRGAAAMVMANLFYAEAWSLVYFLWYSEEDGVPKYRDKLIEYFKDEFELNYGQKEGKSGQELARSPRLMLEKDFYKVFGFEDPAVRQAFYDEWKAYEAALIAKHKNPEWQKERKRILEMLKMKVD